ncbi:formate C-acetyltransferase/glycerol dehydratase family glycyl radical enzyme [Desulfoluna limicola]|uniref:Formate C-acetyltransferase/glycerol dehydratase family glycyl radical enzyme n=1 Tax=Desulfoluna limicola TaxID=2810562 RepID=A0ABM7PJG8_9BACT|nr:pyruvate formate lyase family protein [Desulfoluna limicola]BCS97262.1 formate C-acetyltransferase/glycerol dehydratase family glycyl radical enzyme [Desulfoluna limicola]
MSELTLMDPGFSHVSLENLPRILSLQEAHFRTDSEVCIERARWITDYMKNLRPGGEPMIISRARAVNHYLANREPCFFDDNLLAGSTTSKPLGAPLYPELLGLTIWPELETISDRKINPQKLSPEDADICNFEIFPYWMDRTVLEVTRKKFDNPLSLRLMEKIVFYINGKAGCISHCVPHFDTAIGKGLSHIIAEAAKREKTACDAMGKDFYRAVQIAMAGIIAYATRLSLAAQKLADAESDPLRKKNYLEMAEVCSRVPAKPARTFREAVNSLWLCQVGIHAENINMAMSPGRLDQILYPWYRKDVAEGRLTPEEALELGCCLWLKISDNTNLVPETAERLWGGAGSTPAVTLGGVGRDGEDAVNDLTYIFLKVTELMRLRDPSVNARYHQDKNSRTYRDRVSEVIVSTKAIPAFHNDKVDIETLMNQGVTEADARDYAIVGCVELASAGRDFVASSSIMFNLAAAMEMALLGGKRFITGDEQIGPETGDPSGFTSFEMFWEAFKTQLKWLLEQAIELNDHFGHVHQEVLPSPLLSGLFKGPMEKGMDLVFGGARYNSSGGSHVAFPDVCDSLNAIEYGVFSEKRVTMAEMVDAVKHNFEDQGQEALRLWLSNRIPRFGTDAPVAVKNSRNLVRFIYDVYQEHINYRGGRYRPAYWTMTTHAGQGKLAGALPNGRKAHEPFSSGITPASQAAPNLTEAFRNVACLPAEYIPGGQALNMKYTPPSEGEDIAAYIDRFGSMVDAYFGEGGLQVQFNVQTYEQLMAVKENPALDPHMIVRVSGYSAYFRDLSDVMKDELITRTQYDLTSGKAVPLPETAKGETR